MNRIGNRVFVRSTRTFGIVIAASFIGAGVLNLTVQPTNDDWTPSDAAPIDVLDSEVTTQMVAAPVVLEGVTINLGTGKGRVAGTVTEVAKSGKSFDFREDTVIDAGTDEFGETIYENVPNPYGKVHSVRLRNDGNWYVTGTELTVTLGYRFTVLADAPAAAVAAAA